MKSATKYTLLAVFATTVLTLTAAAQTRSPREDAPQPQMSRAVYLPSQNAARFTQVNRDDHRRCEDDHDRDDRHCHWRDSYVRSDFARGPGYNSHYAINGWYDKHSKWRKDRDRDRD